MHRNRVHWTRFLYIQTEQWTRFLYIQTESIGLGFFTYKPSPMDSFFIDWNRVHWTRFLFFFATRHHKLKTCLSKNSLVRTQKTFSFPPTLTHSPLTQKTQSLSHSHSIPSRSVSVSAPVFHSLIPLRRRPPTAPLPSPSLSPSPLHLTPSQSQLRSLTLIPAPSPSVYLTLIPSPAALSPSPSASPSPSSSPSQQTAGYHSHLISSMWFLGFISLYDFCLFSVSYYYYFFLGVMWIELRLMGFWIFIFIKCLLLLILILYISVIWIEYDYAQVMLTSK